jgi:hypothetical protein
MSRLTRTKKQAKRPAFSFSWVGLFLFCGFIAWLCFAGYNEQQPDHSDMATLGLTPGAIKVFADEPMVLPLDRGEIPVGVLKLNGQTYTIYTTKNDQPQ